MNQHIKKAIAAAKGYAQRAKLIFTQLETTVHAVTVAIVGGGIEALYSQYHSVGHIVFNAATLVEAKAHFLSGAGLALLAWLKAAPALKQSTPPQQP